MSPEQFIRPEEEAAAEINQAIGERREYPDKFSAVVEQATGEFIIEHLNRVREVRFATPQDDAGLPYDQKGFDMVLVWDNGMRMAVDVTITQDSQRLAKKLGPRLPLVMEHDKDGKIITKDIPQATVAYSPEGEDDFYKAYALWQGNGRKGKISDWLRDPVGIEIEILAGLYRSFVEAQGRNPAQAEPFKRAIETLALQIESIATEESQPALSRRALQELAERIKNPLLVIGK